jgi:L-arabinonolactonase
LKRYKTHLTASMPRLIDLWVDAARNLDDARLQGSRDEKTSPSGELLAMIKIPVLRPTCCTFGGDDLRKPYIVTRRIRMSEAQMAATPEAGGIFAVRIETPHASGIVEPRYAG